MSQHNPTYINLNALRDVPIATTDGVIGRVDDFLFDDLTWQIRYVVAELDDASERQRVLLSPAAVKSRAADRLTLNVTRQRVAESPPVDWDKPISRHYESALFDYYRWQPYWRPPVMPGDVGSAMMVPPLTRMQQKEAAAESTEAEVDPHLRSFSEVCGYTIDATDGAVGHLDDLIVLDNDWRIHFLVVKTGIWFFGKSVVVPPAWIETIDWVTQHIRAQLSQDTVREAPEVDTLLRQPATEVG